MRFMHVYHTIKSLSYDWLSMLEFRIAEQCSEQADAPNMNSSAILSLGIKLPVASQTTITVPPALQPTQSQFFSKQTGSATPLIQNKLTCISLKPAHPVDYHHKYDCLDSDIHDLHTPLCTTLNCWAAGCVLMRCKYVHCKTLISAKPTTEQCSRTMRDIRLRTMQQTMRDHTGSKGPSAYYLQCILPGACSMY